MEVINKMEIKTKLFQNKRNKQYNLVLLKKQADEKVLDILNDDSVIGLKLQIVKTYCDSSKGEINKERQRIWDETKRQIVLDKDRIRHRKFRLEHPDKCREYAKRYYQKHKLKVLKGGED